MILFVRFIITVSYWFYQVSRFIQRNAKRCFIVRATTYTHFCILYYTYHWERSKGNNQVMVVAHGDYPAQDLQGDSWEHTH